MYNSDSKGISYTAGFFMLIAFTVAAIVLASIISIPVWTSMTGESILDMEKAMKDPKNSDAIKVMQAITTVIGFLFPAVFTAFLLNRKPLKLMGFKGNIEWRQVGVVAAIVIAALFVSGSLGYLNEQLPVSQSWRATFEKWEKSYMDDMESMIGLDNAGQLLITLVLLAFLPALCEEALFRGGFQNFLTRATRKPWLSIIIVSLIFSAVHLSYYGFLPRLFLGIVLGVIYHYSGRLWLCILAHFLNNAIAVSLLYAYKQQGKSFTEAMNETNDMAYIGLIVLPVVIALLFLFKKISPQPESAKKPGPVDELLRNTPFE